MHIQVTRTKYDMFIRYTIMPAALFLLSCLTQETRQTRSKNGIVSELELEDSKIVFSGGRFRPQVRPPLSAVSDNYLGTHGRPATADTNCPQI